MCRKSLRPLLPAPELTFKPPQIFRFTQKIVYIINYLCQVWYNIPKEMQMTVIKKKVNELKNYPGNPRTINDQEFCNLVNSIKEFGYVQPLIINKDDQVIGGNQRLKALKELGIAEAECILIDLPVKKEKALNLALNKISGDWEPSLLFQFIDDLDPGLIELTGFSDEELDALNVTLDEEEEKLPDEPKLITCPSCGHNFTLGKK